MNAGRVARLAAALILGALPVSAARNAPALGNAPDPDRPGPSSDAYAWNLLNGPYYTVFDISTPDLLPVVAPFPAGGNPLGAGDWVDGTVYMLDTANNLYAVDPGTGALLGTSPVTPPPGGQVWTGLAVDPTTGIVYACTTDIGTSWLYTLDLPSGTATLIGQVTNAPALMAIAIDGGGDLWGLDIVVDSLLAIDKATAAGTLVGPLGYDANFDQGMAWLPFGDTLWIVAFDNVTFQGQLRSVDRATGGTTLVGLLGSSMPGGVNHLTWLGFESTLPPGALFLDGFETGDTSRWTSTVPSGQSPRRPRGVVPRTADVASLRACPSAPAPSSSGFWPPSSPSPPSSGSAGAVPPTRRGAR